MGTNFKRFLKRISPMDVFKILQLSANDFRVTTKKGKQQHYKKLKKIRYFNIINIAGGWWGSQSTTKVQVHNFPLLHFPKWLCLVHAQLAIFLRCVKRLVICKCKCLFLSLRYSTMVSFILWTTFSLTEIHPRRDSAKCELLRLYS